jgi:N-acetylglucosaminyldiphosphoundecaprenol N-acetyl-beta-D-mannosaminyltransferase
MKSFKRIDIIGVPFDVVSFDETVECIRQAVIHEKRIQVVPGNIDFVMKARRDSIFAEELTRADLVIADGVPIVWAASLLDTPLRGRVSGTDLVWSCAAVSADTGSAVALIGGMPGVAERAADKMRQKYPSASLFVIPTPCPLGAEESAEVVRQIQAVHAKILLVALGAPRQERWVQSNMELCQANVGIGIGSAFDIISGDMPRAPGWMKDNGLEWLYRLKQDPRRLAKRYLIEDSPFILHLLRVVVTNKLQAKGASHGQA